MARKAPPLPKLCDRCESFFPSIASETCPQCFAPLTELSPSEAVAASEFQTKRLQDPEFVVRKHDEDEQFKEQSFGACFGVLGLFVGVFILSAILIHFAGTSKHNRALLLPSSVSIINQDFRPVDLLPLQLGNLGRGEVTQIKQAGVDFTVSHAVYGDKIQLYALPSNAASVSSISSFRLIVSAICSQTSPPLVAQEVHTRLAYYAVIGVDGGLVGETAERLLNGSATH